MGISADSTAGAAYRDPAGFAIGRSQGARQETQRPLRDSCLRPRVRGSVGTVDFVLLLFCIKPLNASICGDRAYDRRYSRRATAPSQG